MKVDKNYTNSHENFSEIKMIKQFGSPLSKRIPLFNESLSRCNFFITPYLSEFQKQETPNFRGEETMHKKEDVRISGMISFWQYYFGSSKPANFQIFKISRKSLI